MAKEPGFLDELGKGFFREGGICIHVHAPEIGASGYAKCGCGCCFYCFINRRKGKEAGFPPFFLLLLLFLPLC